MILRAYDQKLVGQFTTVGTGLSVYVSWATIQGTTSTVIDSDNNLASVLGDGGTYDLMDYADTGTQVADPNRMRKIETIQVKNNAITNRPLQFYIVSIGPTWSGAYELTPAFDIPAGGMLHYSPTTGWRIHNAAGRIIGGAGYGPGGW